MAKDNLTAPKCNPPIDCFNCHYDDCCRNGGVTKSETEYIKSAGFAKGRHYDLPLATDYVHNRSTRLI